MRQIYVMYNVVKKVLTCVDLTMAVRVCVKWSKLIGLHVRDNAVDELVIVC